MESLSDGGARRARLQAMADEAKRRAHLGVPVHPLVDTFLGQEDGAEIAAPGDAGLGFARWLLGQQRHRRAWIARLAAAARTDPRWPRDGDADAVRAYLNEQGADGDMFEAVDDAELEWLCF